MDKIKALWGNAVDWCKGAWEKAVVWSLASWVRVRAYPRWFETALFIVLAVAISTLFFLPNRKAEVETATPVIYPPVYTPPPVTTLPPPPVRKTVRIEKAKSNRSPVSQVQSEDVVLPEPEPAAPPPPIPPITRESVDQYRAALRKE